MNAELWPFAIDSEDALWEKLHTVARDWLGITSILYGFTHSRYIADRVGISRSLYIRHSHPKDYVDHFEDDSFLNDDLCSAILLEQVAPFLWHHSAQREGATEAQQERARIDARFNMDVGVSLGFRFADGHGIAGVGLCARGASAEYFEQQWHERGGEMTAYLAAFEPLMRARMIAGRISLSERQRQVLAFSAGGMQAKEIAAHLNIAEKTVHNYREDAREAMGADTTMEAIAKAIVYRMI